MKIMQETEKSFKLVEGRFSVKENEEHARSFVESQVR